MDEIYKLEQEDDDEQESTEWEIEKQVEDDKQETKDWEDEKQDL